MAAKYSFIPLLVVFAMVISACGSTLVVQVTPTPTVKQVVVSTPSPTSTPEATATPEPTNTPTPEPTATPTLEPTNTPTPEPTHTPTATATPTPKPRLPFEGTFEGTVNGDEGSSAPLTVDLTQDGVDVSGTATLGEGLLVNVGAGLCPGVQTVPAATLDLNAQTSASNPRHLEKSTSLVVSGYNIGVNIAADVSADGEELSVLLNLITPFPCRNPELRAVLTRTQ